MKKILLFVLLFMPFFVLAEGTCNQDDIKIESIVLDSTKGNIVETSNPNTDNNQVNLGLKMNVIDDSITYKIVITNSSKEDYTFDKNSLSTDYVNYDITYEDNSDIVKAGESKVIYLTVNYSNKPSMDKLDNGVLIDNPKVTFNLQKEEAQTVIEEVVRKIVNPETKDVIGIFMLILIISLIITIGLFRRSRKIKYTIMLIILILLTSNIVRALCTCTLNVNVKLEIDTKEAVFLPGKEVNIKMKELAGDDLSTVTNGYSFKDENITAIKHSELEPSDSNKQGKNIVSTADSEHPIYMWFDNGTIYWWSEDKTPSLNEDSSYMFFRLYKMLTTEELSTFDATKVKDLSYMFYQNELLKDIKGLDKWNVLKLESLRGTFGLLNSLEYIDELESWNTSNVVTIEKIFWHNHSLKNLNAIKNWNVEKVKSFTQAFNSCYSIEEIDLSNWETKSLELMITTFAMWDENGNPYLDNNLKRIIISNKFDTSKVTDMYGTFANLNLDSYEFLKLIDTSSVINLRQTLQNNSFTTLEYIKDWDVSNVQDFSLTFIFCDNLTDVSSINNWNINKDSNFDHMFYKTSLHPEFTKVQGTWDNNGTFTPNS